MATVKKPDGEWIVKRKGHRATILTYANQLLSVCLSSLLCQFDIKKKLKLSNYFRLDFDKNKDSFTTNSVEPLLI